VGGDHDRRSKPSQLPVIAGRKSRLSKRAVFALAAPGAATHRSTFLDHRDLRPVMTEIE
jgi:hypothetical protein